MKRTLGIGATALAMVATGIALLANADDANRDDAAFSTCADSENVDLDALRQAPTASAETHPGYPTSNLVVLLLPAPAGSAHCYFRRSGDGTLTLLVSSRD